MRFLLLLVIPLLSVTRLCAEELSRSAVKKAKAAIDIVLNDWHAAAAQSDEERYFKHMAPEAVFIGPDEKERWEKDDFRKWAHPGFQERMIWQFTAYNRTITVAPEGTVAWFDELVNMSGSGTGRGTGVMVKQGDTWTIAQYSLSLPIPRLVFNEVLAVVNTQKPKPQPEPESPSNSRAK